MPTSAPQPIEDLAQLATRFGAIYTGALTDVLDTLGRRAQTLPAGIVPLAEGMRVAGPVFAVEGRGRAMDPETCIRRILEMLGAIPAHHVAVYKAGDDTCAHFGELSATALLARGCAGVVLDGGCRDVSMVKATGLPVFARYATPQDAVSRWEVLDWGHSVDIGGVRAATGDYVVADADGVVIVPADLRDEVLRRAEAVTRTESEVRTAVAAGMAPLEAYERFGKF
jgi:4-hydroxy-4-methyl-2-oxoglutarate aldolase